jgi:hypothetical protein
MLAVVALHRGLQARLHEARRLIELTVSYGGQFKRLGDLPALVPISEAGLEPRYSTACSRSRTGLPEPAAPNRDGAKRAVMAIFRGEGPAGDIRGGARAPSVCGQRGRRVCRVGPPLHEAQQPGAAIRAREQRIAADDPDLMARERVTLTGRDGQLALFYGPELAARVRAGGPRRSYSRRATEHS